MVFVVELGQGKRGSPGLFDLDPRFDLVHGL